MDVREFHVHAAEWTPERVSFFIDDEHVKTVHQSPSYAMQLMLSIYVASGCRGGAAHQRLPQTVHC